MTGWSDQKVPLYEQKALLRWPPGLQTTRLVNCTVAGSAEGPHHFSFMISSTIAS